MSRTLLKQVLGVQTHSRHTEPMQAFIATFAESRGMTVRNDDGNVYVTKGEAKVYPCIVAHTDTVHSIIAEANWRVMESDGIIWGMDIRTMNFSGIGGDDKCGVYIALALLDELPACKAAFFRDEEIGCLGAFKADMSFFDDCAFALQADRRGSRDVVVEACGDVMTSDDFNARMFKAMAKHGMEYCRHGAMTDVQELKANGLGICAINVSAGYHNPHTHREYVSVRQVMNTKAFMKMLCLTMGGKRWEHTTPQQKWGRYDYEYGWGSGYVSWRDDKNAGQSVKEFMQESLLRTEDNEKTDSIGRVLTMIDGIMHLVVTDKKDLEGASCPECWNTTLYYDYAEGDVWCSSCIGYVPVIVSEKDPLALPAGEGAG